MNCSTARSLLVLQEEDEQLAAHVATCPACASEEQRQQVLNTVLRTELCWQTPADLSARLLALVPGAEPAYVPPSRWYVALTYLLTVLAVTLSIMVAWQIYPQLVVLLGLPTLLEQVLAIPGRGVAWLYETLPQSRYAVALLLSLRDQLHWVLLALVMWAALDNYRSRVATNQVA